MLCVLRRRLHGFGGLSSSFVHSVSTNGRSQHRRAAQHCSQCGQRRRMSSGARQVEDLVDQTSLILTMAAAQHSGSSLQTLIDGERVQLNSPPPLALFVRSSLCVSHPSIRVRVRDVTAELHRQRLLRCTSAQLSSACRLLSFLAISITAPHRRLTRKPFAAFLFECFVA